MVSPKALEAWFALMAEAMRGTKEAQEAIRTLSEMSTTSEDLSRWMAKFMPASVASPADSQTETFEAWLEEWWRMMGVVPRSRYLELLEKYDMLNRRLEKAEQTIKNLRSMLENRGQEEEAKKVMNLWSTMLEETLKTQAEWLQTWTAPDEQANAADDQQSAVTDDDLDNNRKT